MTKCSRIIIRPGIVELNCTFAFFRHLPFEKDKVDKDSLAGIQEYRHSTHQVLPLLLFWNPLISLRIGGEALSEPCQWAELPR